MKLTFDDRGYLKPYDLIEIDWDTFVEKFVTSFPNSFTRNFIFTAFNTFTISIQSLLKQKVEVWINGSFTTLKENPNDIDIVLFVPNSLMSKQIQEFVLKNQRDNESKIDAYLVEVFSEDYRSYIFYETDQKYWLSQFGTTSPNRRKERFVKGIIKITI